MIFDSVYHDVLQWCFIVSSHQNKEPTVIQLPETGKPLKNGQSGRELGSSLSLRGHGGQAAQVSVHDMSDMISMRTATPQVGKSPTGKLHKKVGQAGPAGAMKCTFKYQKHIVIDQKSRLMNRFLFFHTVGRGMS